MGFGDEIIAAGQAQRLFDRNGLKVQIVDKHLRARWHPIWEGNPVILKEGNREGPQRVQQLVSAPNARPYIIYPFTAESGWTFNREFHAREHVAKIYLTTDEKLRGIHVRQGGPFILVEPWSKHTNLRWPRAQWQRFAQIARGMDLRLVQHTHSATDYVLDGVEQVDTTSFRDACGILNSASLYIRGESGMCHAAAALSIPQVTIWGACMDWDVLGGYPKQRGVGRESVHAVCGRYLPCADCATVMQDISPGEVQYAVQKQIDQYGLR